LKDNVVFLTYFVQKVMPALSLIRV